MFSLTQSTPFFLNLALKHWASKKSALGGQLRSWGTSISGVSSKTQLAGPSDAIQVEDWVIHVAAQTSSEQKPKKDQFVEPTPSGIPVYVPKQTQPTNTPKDNNNKIFADKVDEVKETNISTNGSGKQIVQVS